MSRAFIALGSNLQDPLAQLQRATDSIAAIAGSQLCACSPIYRSTAVGPGQQPDYLNAVVALETDLTPLALLDALQAIENKQGRKRAVRWGARTLDLDILLYNNDTVTHPRLSIPHPRLHQRNFVLYPLADICEPNLMLPGGAEVGTLVTACPRGDLQRTEYSLRDNSGGGSRHTGPDAGELGH